MRRRLVLTACLWALTAAPAWAQTPVVVEYYHLDAVGSVRAITDAGRTAVVFDYAPFGDGGVGGGASPAALGFAGKERDAETGLDYFGARYYGSRTRRFTTVDPVYTWQENLVDPQRWNRYAYARNNPLRFTDPDGREVKYANPQLQSLFTQLAVRSEMVRGTLELYTGAGKPDLLISQSDAGFDIGGDKAAGSFSPTGYNVVYPTGDAAPKPGMSLEQIENTGKWTITGGKLILDSSLKIDIRDKNTVNTAAHELGHADYAARDALGYKRDAANIYRPNGRLIPHDQRVVERKADAYKDRVMSQIRF